MSDQERELKVLLSKEQYQTLLKSLKFDHIRTHVNTYYDDDQGSLKSRGMALRIRQTEGKNILTIKKPLDAITKYEYEISVHTSDFSKLNPSEKEWIDNHMPFQMSFHPIVTFTTIRHILNLPDAEVSLDETQFRNHTDYEIEYEYRHEHDGITVFNHLLQPAGIQFTKNGPSKLARAMRDQESENL